jgi:hypothetical protein
MRKKVVLAFLMAGGSLSMAVWPAAADGPFVQDIPAAACDNAGTHNAHDSIPAGAPGHPHVPHRMGPAMLCMTMPGVHP